MTGRALVMRGAFGMGLSVTASVCAHARVPLGLTFEEQFHLVRRQDRRLRLAPAFHDGGRLRRRLHDDFEIADDYGHLRSSLRSQNFGTFMSMSWPGLRRRGFSMPLLRAMRCQSCAFPIPAASFCSDDPEGASAA